MNWEQRWLLESGNIRNYLVSVVYISSCWTFISSYFWCRMTLANLHKLVGWILAYLERNWTFSCKYIFKLMSNCSDVWFMISHIALKSKDLEIMSVKIWNLVINVLVYCLNFSLLSTHNQVVLLNLFSPIVNKLNCNSNKALRHVWNPRMRN